MGRTRLLWGASALATLTLLASPASAVRSREGGTVRRASGLAAQVISQINATRKAQGLAPLRISPSLSAAAAAHSRQMARLGYFSHDSADGSSMSDRVGRYYRLRGYRYWAVGENLVWASPSLGARNALELWMGSPPHRANLLSARWREVGLVAVHADSAPGVYGGRPVTIVTADFGVRR